MPRDAFGKNKKYGHHKNRHITDLNEEKLMTALSQADKNSQKSLLFKRNSIDNNNQLKLDQEPRDLDEDEEEKNHQDLIPINKLNSKMIVILIQMKKYRKLKLKD